MPNMRDWTPEQRAAANRKSAETRRARHAAREAGETSESETLDDGPELETTGGKSGKPKPKRPPKIAKSALLTSMTEHAATIGARGLQAASWRAMGRRNALTVKEAQGLVQPAGRLVARRAALHIQLPGMTSPDADDVGEDILTIAEYLLP